MSIPRPDNLAVGAALDSWCAPGMVMALFKLQFPRITAAETALHEYWAVIPGEIPEAKDQRVKVDPRRSRGKMNLSAHGTFQ